jgi:hypothetical protein
MRITLLVVLLLSIAGSTLAQDLWIRRSPAVNAYWFEAVAAIGDINGDGCSDLAQPVHYAPGTPRLRPPSMFCASSAGAITAFFIPSAPISKMLG